MNKTRIFSKIIAGVSERGLDLLLITIWCAVIITIVSFPEAVNLLLLLILALIVTSIVFKKSWVLIPLYLILGTSIFDITKLPSINIGGINDIYLIDILSILLLIVLFINYKKLLTYHHNKTIFYFLLFITIRFIFTSIQLFIGIGTIRDFAIEFIRNQVPSLVFFIFLINRNPVTKNIMGFGQIIGIITVSFFIAVSISGNVLFNSDIFLIKSNLAVMSFAGLRRIVSPGLLLSIPIYFFSYSFFLYSNAVKNKLWNLIGILLGLFGLIIYGFRSIWITVIFLTVIMTFIQIMRMYKSEHKTYRIVSYIISLLLLTVIVFILYENTTGYISEIINRTITIFDSIDNNDPSFINRINDIKWAWKVIKTHPITGMAIGKPFSEVSINLGSQWIGISHNGYVSLALNYGLLTVIPFLLLIINLGKDIIRQFYSANNPYREAIFLGLIGLFFEFILINFVNSLVTSMEGNMLFSILIGLSLEPIIKGNGYEKKAR